MKLNTDGEQAKKRQVEMWAAILEISGAVSRKLFLLALFRGQTLF